MLSSRERSRAIAVFVFLITSPLFLHAATAPTFTRPLVQGSQGADVTALQQILQSQGYFQGDTTGYFDPLTAQAVESFQSAHNLDAVGFVGPLTLSLLNSMNKGKVLGASTSAFAVGVQVKTTAKLNVRATPSTTGSRLGSEPKGALGTIIGGPATANGYAWWQITWSTGLTGWSIQNYLAVITTTPLPGPDTAPPSAPTNLSATAASNSQINLTWTASTDNIGVTGYQIFRNGVEVNTSTINVYSDTGLTASTNYMYMVKAADAAGNVSVASNSASAITPSIIIADITSPTTPTNLTATAISSSQINLTWTTSTDAVGVMDYKIFRNGTQVGTATTNSFSDTGLTASTNYSYTVSAYDAAGNNSAQSSAASAITQATFVITGSPQYPTSRNPRGKLPE